METCSLKRVDEAGASDSGEICEVAPSSLGRVRRDLRGGAVVSGAGPAQSARWRRHRWGGCVGPVPALPPNEALRRYALAGAPPERVSHFASLISRQTPEKGVQSGIGPQTAVPATSGPAGTDGSLTTDTAARGHPTHAAVTIPPRERTGVRRAVTPRRAPAGGPSPFISLLPSLSQLREHCCRGVHPEATRAGVALVHDLSVEADHVDAVRPAGVLVLHGVIQ